ncbi:hypothetical protein SCHIN_v1c07410 [Spiroplasma chinense]|uniref:Uncharacterized protein n=1 Tax=Spiroplasma chinense TaxID=216932 RepID=A0A5B9Y5E6_9MOLU|nr:hypothetical protein SCHIN_v1c07410 [Spiroplasma chinense]
MKKIALYISLGFVLVGLILLLTGYLLHGFSDFNFWF